MSQTMHVIENEDGDAAGKAEAPRKKGNRSWQAPVGETLEKDSKFGYRWMAEVNIRASLQEGWELVKAKPGEVTFADGKDKVFGGIALDTVVAKRDRVLMRMPKEMVVERNAFYGNKAEKQIEAIKLNVDEAAGVATHGKVDIQRGNVRTIIE